MIIFATMINLLIFEADVLQQEIIANSIICLTYIQTV